MPFVKINVFEEAKNLSQPFLVMDLAEIDDFAARLFTSRGMVAWHKHVDQEQLFLTLDGELTLETEWGNAVLRSGEMAVIPKSVTHRCGSVALTTAMVFERRFFSNRQNGQRRLFVMQGAGEIRPVSVGGESLLLGEPAVPRQLTHVDDLVLSVIRFGAEVQERVCHLGSELLLVHKDSLLLEGEPGTISLGMGELAVVPKSINYRVRAPDGAVVLLAGKTGTPKT